LQGKPPSAKLNQKSKIMSPEIKITAVEISRLAPVKSRDMRGPCFAVGVRYSTAEEGRNLYISRVTTQRKKDMPAALEREKKAVEEGQVSVQKHDDGTCVFIHRLSLGF
jgi:hypothetical protein